MFLSDLNNLRKCITTIVYNYVIKKIGELASRSSWLSGKASGHESKGKPKGFKAHKVHVSIEIKRKGAGMLGEQGGKSK